MKSFRFGEAKHLLLAAALLALTAFHSAKPTKVVSSDPNVITYNELIPLEIKQLATEASKIKIRIQKARQTVKAMPDVDRTVEEQQEEIEELEAKCEALRAVLKGMATRAGHEDGAAQGTTLRG